MNINKNNTILRSLKVSYREFSNERAFRHGAALSYYTLFSLVPIMVIVITAFGWIFGQAEVEAVLFSTLSENLGDESIALWQRGVHNLSTIGEHSVLVKVVGISILVFSSTAVFYSMKNSIHALWHIPISSGRFMDSVIDRLISFAILVVLGFVMIVVFFLESVLSTSIDTITVSIGLSDNWMIIAANFIVGIIANTAFFYLIYRWLPDVRLKTKILWVGSLVIAFIFQIGSSLIGYYLHSIDLNSTYGIIGSIMLVLAWVYYCAQVIFFGAKFLYIYSQESGLDMKYKKYRNVRQD